MAGCHATQKGSYPVSMGVGFPTAGVNISPDDIHFHDTGVPDVAIITSADGLGLRRKRIESMKNGVLIIDQSLPAPPTGAEVMQFDFRQIGVRTTCLPAIFSCVKHSGIFPLDALRDAIEEAGMGEKLPLKKIYSLI